MSRVVTSLSTCRYCQSQIIWVDQRPHNVLPDGNGDWKPGVNHNSTCIAKNKPKRVCPVCLLMDGVNILEFNRNEVKCQLHLGHNTVVMNDIPVDVSPEGLTRRYMEAKLQVRRSQRRLKQVYDNRLTMNSLDNFTGSVKVNST